MNKTDVLTGRIVQRVLDEMNKRTNVTIVHGVDKSHNLSELMRNLWLYFPDSLITFKKLNFGYELRIEVGRHENYHKESDSVVVNVRDKIAKDILSGKGLPKL